MKRKDYKETSLLVWWWLPLSTWMQDWQPLNRYIIWGISVHPDCSADDRCKLG